MMIDSLKILFILLTGVLSLLFVFSEKVGAVEVSEAKELVEEYIN